MAGSPFDDVPSARCVPPTGSTKRRLLTLLKRHAALTVDDLASALSIAPMTARQHLTALERDGLVLAEEQRGGPGRPRHLYRLTEAGNAVFLDRYDLVAAALLREVSELDGADLLGLTSAQKRDLLLSRLAEREAERHAVRMAGMPFTRRVSAVTELLQSSGGIVEHEATVNGVEIRDYNCPYRRLTPGQTQCVWHQVLLSRLFAAPVHASVAGDMNEAQCCRFMIPARAEAAIAAAKSPLGAARTGAESSPLPVERLS